MVMMVEASRCTDDGYRETSDGKCVFLDKSECPVDFYEQKKCASKTELFLIHSWMDSNDKDAAEKHLYQDVDKPWLNDLELPSESGRCMAYMIRWAYSVTENKCSTFIYGGCNGNLNRFMSETDCYQAGHILKQRK